MPLPPISPHVLFASEPGDEFDSLQKALWVNGCEVVPVGLGEALWLWPMSGYDLVLIKAKEDPETGIELCCHIKRECPAQRVALLLGDRAGILPHHFEADAVVSGTPSSTEFIAVLRLLLAPEPSAGVTRKAVQRSGGRRPVPEAAP
jgi:hypothetical protein